MSLPGRAGHAARRGEAVREADARFMRLALREARRGLGRTRPNPAVGAVVVRAGRVIARGHHRRAGGPHAEVVALRQAGTRARGATLYVTLEPCAHTGRTGPCTEAILRAGIARVVIGCRDPNPLVDGRGAARLRRAGLRVTVGCLERDCRELNRAFFTWITARRPLVTLKLATSADGFVAPPPARRRPRAPHWLTGPAARRRAHALRAAHDAILVGSATVLADDPALTVRHGPRRQRQPGPLRVVLDGRLRTPPTARLLREGEAEVLIVTGQRTARAHAAARRALIRAGAEVLALPAGRARRPPLARVLASLAARGVQSLLVEGGSAVATAFLRAGLVDRVALFWAPLLLGRGVPMLAGPGLPRALALAGAQVERVGPDLLIVADVTAMTDLARGRSVR